VQGAKLGFASIVEVLDFALDEAATRSFGVTSVVDGLDHELTNAVILDRGFVGVEVGNNAIGQLVLEVLIAESIEGVIEAGGGSSSGVFHNEGIIAEDLIGGKDYFDLF